MASADQILAQMTLAEKAGLLTGDTAWTTTEVAHAGLRALRVADGPHGVRRTHVSESMAFAAHPATCFPTASCLSATWDPGLVEEVAGAIAREAAALEVDVVLGPGVNIKRSPLCGRNFEYFSEDPYLAGVLATAWIQGAQAEGVGASLKHLAVNNQETRRMSVSAEVDEATLRELYLPAFEAAVRDARPWTVMCSYNRINGTYASQHEELLTRILREEWGFDGFVVSDWAAVHDRPASVAAGVDLEMPGPRPRRVQAVLDAVHAGTLEEAAVDRAARRIVEVILRASETPKGGAPADLDAHHRLARRAAAEGMVLLKNDEGMLPLEPGMRIAVIGEAARTPRFQGGGSSQITPTRIDEPLAEIRALAGPEHVVYAQGDGDGRDEADLRTEAAGVAAASDVAVVFLGMPVAKESEGGDRSDIDFTAQQVALVQAVARAQARTVVVMLNGSAVAVAPWIDGVAAVIEGWYAGQAAGGAVADILFGVVNPSGRLAETFPVRLEDTPAYLNFPGDGDRVRYAEGVFVGYRWYDTRRVPVSFPFGHGLSYTTFAYAGAHVSADAFTAEQGTTVSVEVTNTGSRHGSEVVQVYVRECDPVVRRPDKELRGFAKVALAPGETKRVEVVLGARAFSHWNPERHAWEADQGEYEVVVGSSAEAIHATIPVTLRATEPPAPRLTDMSPLQDWLHDESSRPATIGLLRELAPILGETFGAAADDPEHLDPHFYSYFGTMPMRGLLEFAAPAGGPEPETRLRNLMGSLPSGG